MNTASIELCRELYELAGWHDTYWNYSRSSGTDGPFRLGHKGSIETREVKERYPAYELGFLQRKLPYGFTIVTRFNEGWLASWAKTADADDYATEADTPENAVCELAIELFKQGVLKKEET